MTEPRTLPNHVNAPPGGWRYKVPETNQLLVATNEGQLLSQIKAHYKANGYPPIDNDTLRGRIETFICTTAPEHCVGNGPQALDPVGFSFHTVLQGTRTIGMWAARSLLKGARQFVPTEQANDRARVCLSCPYNDQPQGCTGCNSSAMTAAVKLIIGGRTTSYDAQLKACRVCGCDLKAKVQLPLQDLRPYMTEDQLAKLPDYCWINTEERPVDDQSTTNPI